jgi:hypothetical protein
MNVYGNALKDAKRGANNQNCHEGTEYGITEDPGKHSLSAVILGTLGWTVGQVIVG